MEITERSAKITEILYQMALYIHKQNIQEDDTLFSGKTGLSLFYFLNYQLTKEEESINVANMLLAQERDRLQNISDIPNFINQLQWFLWANFYLNKNDLIDFEISDLDSIKTILEIELQKHFKSHNFDLFYGAIGTGLTNQYIYKQDYFVKIFSNFFDSFKEVDGGCIKWKSTSFDTKEQEYNYSLAHGIPSIIVFLNKIYSIQPSKSIEKNIYESVLNLLSVENDVKAIGSHFPSRIRKTDSHLFSRLAWCYGDLGCGYSILISAITLKNRRFYNKAIEILKNSANRRDPESSLINDLGICHGSSGLVMFYDRLYKITNEPFFKETSTFWLDYTVNSIIEKGSLSNVLSWRAPQYGGPTNELGFLKGLAGIGMVLISAISDIETSWDECLLLTQITH